MLCLTATAKPDVKEDIRAHFRDRLDIELRVFDGGARRTNLEFVVVRTTPGEKFAHLHQILAADLPPETPGGAIIYCATRQRSEDVAQFLREKDVAADHFHAGLSPEIKKTVQQRFIEGGSRVIAATNAFGMGIDKPDVRLVVHADVPGSLENYLQEAGRAGRDRAAARCVLLYTPEDVERQFGLSARSRLTRREIHGILKALRRLGRKKRAEGKVAGTSSSRAVSSSRPGGRNKKRMEGEVVATAGGGQRPGVYLAQAQARARQRRAPGRRHAIPAPLATQSRGCMEAPSTNARLVTCRWHGRRSAGYAGCRCPRVTGSRWRAAR